MNNIVNLTWGKDLKEVDTKNKVKKYGEILIGVIFLAISFNLFFYPRKIVYGGVSGLAIAIHSLWDIDPAIFILIINMILIMISFLILGKEKTYKSISVAILFPLFIKMTSNITSVIDLSDVDTLTVALFGGVVSGFSGGLIYKAGYTTGGTDIISQILSNCKRISMGKALLMINIIVIFIGTLAAGWTMALYAIIVLYIISIITDKVILGVSNSKAFYIITAKEKELTKFILNNLSHGITILNAEGGFSGKKTKVLLCVIPTKEYFKLVDGINKLDKDAFFMVTDAYEVQGAE